MEEGLMNEVTRCLMKEGLMMNDVMSGAQRMEDGLMDEVRSGGQDEGGADGRGHIRSPEDGG